jgi:hypothetical protein
MRFLAALPAPRPRGLKAASTCVATTRVFYAPKPDAPAQLQVTGTELVHPEALTWIAVGDLAVIEPNAHKQDLSEIELLDTDGHVLR